MLNCDYCTIKYCLDMSCDRAEGLEAGNLEVDLFFTAVFESFECYMMFNQIIALIFHNTM